MMAVWLQMKPVTVQKRRGTTTVTNHPTPQKKKMRASATHLLNALVQLRSSGTSS
jgi:hypothetical protein